MVPSLFDAFSIFSTRFTVKNRYFPLLLPVKMTKMRQNDPKWQILGRVWVLEPSVDCKKVSRVVPEQVPGSSGPV